VELLPELRTNGEGRPLLTEAAAKSLNAKEIFQSMEWSDLWEDANMFEVIHYLRGNTHLEIPADWRSAIPTEL
jgi:uncharacterized protein YjlB